MESKNITSYGQNLRLYSYKLNIHFSTFTMLNVKRRGFTHT